MFGFAPHDHARCIDGALAAAEARCADAGLRLTPVRRRVLALLLREHRAMGAYEILDALRAEGLGAQPPTAYRALEFLTANGFAHRIERLNAFVACTGPEAPHAAAFLICRSCDAVAEAPAPAAGAGLDAAAAGAGFAIESAVIEAEGLCPRCRPATAEAPA
jgi:Fur family zinc uptake transcriptional regulator